MECKRTQKKECKVCGEVRVAGRFYKNSSTCLICKPQVKPIIPSGHYHCNVCSTVKVISEFYEKQTTRCKECFKAKQTQYYRNMPEKVYKAHVAVAAANNKHKYNTDPEYRQKMRDRHYFRYHNEVEYREKHKESSRQSRCNNK